MTPLIAGSLFLFLYAAMATEAALSDMSLKSGIDRVATENSISAETVSLHSPGHLRDQPPLRFSVPMKGRFLTPSDSPWTRRAQTARRAGNAIAQKARKGLRSRAKAIGRSILATSIFMFGGRMYLRMRTPANSNSQFAAIGDALGQPQWQIRQLVAAQIRQSDAKYAQEAIGAQLGTPVGDRMVAFIRQSGKDIRPAWANAVENGVKLNGPRFAATAYQGDDATLAFASEALPKNYIQVTEDRMLKPRIIDTGDLKDKKPITLEYDPQTRHYNFLKPVRS